MLSFQRRHSASRIVVGGSHAASHSGSCVDGAQWMGLPQRRWLDALACALVVDTVRLRAESISWTRHHRRRLSLEAPDLSECSPGSVLGYRPGVWRSRSDSSSPPATRRHAFVVPTSSVATSTQLPPQRSSSQRDGGGLASAPSKFDGALQERRDLAPWSRSLRLAAAITTKGAESASQASEQQLHEQHEVSSPIELMLLAPGPLTVTEKSALRPFDALAPLSSLRSSVLDPRPQPRLAAAAAASGAMCVPCSPPSQYTLEAIALWLSRGEGRGGASLAPSIPALLWGSGAPAVWPQPSHLYQTITPALGFAGRSGQVRGAHRRRRRRCLSARVTRVSTLLSGAGSKGQPQGEAAFLCHKGCACRLDSPLLAALRSFYWPNLCPVPPPGLPPGHPDAPPLLPPARQAELLRLHYHPATLHAFYSDAAVLQRESLRLDPRLQAPLRDLWAVYVSHLGARMHRGGYLLVMSHVQRSVRAWHAHRPAARGDGYGAAAELAVDPEDDSEAARHARSQLLRRDWQRDSGGAETIGWDAFYAAMFQLIDLWTPTVGLRAYEGLAAEILAALTRPLPALHRRPRSLTPQRSAGLGARSSAGPRPASAPAPVRAAPRPPSAARGRSAPTREFAFVWQHIARYVDARQAAADAAAAQAQRRQRLADLAAAAAAAAAADAAEVSRRDCARAAPAEASAALQAAAEAELRRLRLLELRERAVVLRRHVEAVCSGARSLQQACLLEPPAQCQGARTRPASADPASSPTLVSPSPWLAEFAAAAASLVRHADPGRCLRASGDAAELEGAAAAALDLDDLAPDRTAAALSRIVAAFRAVLRGAGRLCSEARNRLPVGRPPPAAAPDASSSASSLSWRRSSGSTAAGGGGGSRAEWGHAPWGASGASSQASRRGSGSCFAAGGSPTHSSSGSRPASASAVGAAAEQPGSVARVSDSLQLSLPPPPRGPPHPAATAAAAAQEGALLQGGGEGGEGDDVAAWGDPADAGPLSEERRRQLLPLLVRSRAASAAAAAAAAAVTQDGIPERLGLRRPPALHYSGAAVALASLPRPWSAPLRAAPAPGPPLKDASFASDAADNDWEQTEGAAAPGPLCVRRARVASASAAAPRPTTSLVDWPSLAAALSLALEDGSPEEAVPAAVLGPLGGTLLPCPVDLPPWPGGAGAAAIAAAEQHVPTQHLSYGSLSPLAEAAPVCPAPRPNAAAAAVARGSRASLGFPAVVHLPEPHQPPPHPRALRGPPAPPAAGTHAGAGKQPGSQPHGGSQGQSAGFCITGTRRTLANPCTAPHPTAAPLPAATPLAGAAYSGSLRHSPVQPPRGSRGGGAAFERPPAPRAPLACAAPRPTTHGSSNVAAALVCRPLQTAAAAAPAAPTPALPPSAVAAASAGNAGSASVSAVAARGVPPQQRRYHAHRQSLRGLELVLPPLRLPLVEAAAGGGAAFRGFSAGLARHLAFMSEDGARRLLLAQPPSSGARVTARAEAEAAGDLEPRHAGGASPFATEWL